MPGNKLETSHGYFKLDPDQVTVLDLNKTYILAHVKWIYFTAISPTNPQHRAWFHAIRGPAFGKPSFHGKYYIQSLFLFLIGQQCYTCLQ
jgi:hypothetical protein